LVGASVTDALVLVGGHVFEAGQVWGTPPCCTWGCPLAPMLFDIDPPVTLSEGAEAGALLWGMAWCSVGVLSPDHIDCSKNIMEHAQPACAPSCVVNIP
jgi:hypothetical protein